MMTLRRVPQVALLALSMIPVLGTTCATEKTISFVINEQAEGCFEARGTINVDLGSDTYDLKSEIDLAQILADNDIDPADIRDVSFKGLCYKITKADVNSPDREIQNGELSIQFDDDGSSPFSRPKVVLGTGFNAFANQVTDWIDITDQVQAAGVSEINAFLDRCLAAVQAGATAADTWVTYEWSGISAPTNVETDFDWKVKVVINIVPTVTQEFPDF